MRTYLILREKARRFAADHEIAAAAASVAELARPTIGRYSAAAAELVAKPGDQLS